MAKIGDKETKGTENNTNSTDNKTGNNIALPTANVATETPAKEMTDAEKIAFADAEVARKKLADEKAKSAAKIADLEDYIRKAKAKRAKYNDIADDDEMGQFVRKTLMESQPNNWNAIMTDPETFQKELDDYKLSLLSPEEKDFAVRWKASEDAIAAAQKGQADLKADIISKYPDFFGAIAPKKEKKTTTGEKVADAERKEFAGVLNSKEVDTQKVKDLVAAGITSETEMIGKIYGTDFTINGSKPRFQIHAIRDTLGLIVKNG